MEHLYSVERKYSSRITSFSDKIKLKEFVARRVIPQEKLKFFKLKVNDTR